MYKHTQRKAKPKPKPLYTRKQLEQAEQEQFSDSPEGQLFMRKRQWLRGAKFLTSAAKANQCPDDIGCEIAFAGRSNAGKSSAINTICDHNQLARASKRPGRTQMINYFILGENQHLVDLPGYGYAAVPEAMKILWQKELEKYLLERKSLQGLVLLMDIRHPLQDYDQMMLEWAHKRGLFVHILLTKSDKLNTNPAYDVMQSTINFVAEKGWQVSVQLFSSLKKIGLEELTEVIALKLAYTDGVLAITSC